MCIFLLVNFKMVVIKINFLNYFLKKFSKKCVKTIFIYQQFVDLSSSNMKNLLSYLISKHQTADILMLKAVKA